MSHLMLNVPFNEKDEVKRKGARWNPELKKWYVPDGKSSLQFIPWIQELKDSTKYQLYNECVSRIYLNFKLIPNIKLVPACEK